MNPTYDIDPTKTYELVRKTPRRRKTVVRTGDVSIGDGDFVVMAGPCSVESEEQIMASCEAVKRAGAHILRGGAFKPATYPYRFMGLGEQGLQLLARARAVHGLPIITEVMEPHDAPLVTQYADILQIGTRSMQNYRLLEAVAKTDKPVFLKRGTWATLDEWLGAAEYIVAGGNPNVILCERGIVSLEDHCRWTLSLSVVPALKQITHLPIIVDPSHGTGRSQYVLSMSRAAVAAGADGLMVEVHPDPPRSVSDASQALGFEEFATLMSHVKAIADVMTNLH